MADECPLLCLYSLNVPSKITFKGTFNRYRFSVNGSLFSYLRFSQCRISPVFVDILIDANVGVIILVPLERWQFIICCNILYDPPHFKGK